jgi:probable rRNA maturation factor
MKARRDDRLRGNGKSRSPRTERREAAMILVEAETSEEWDSSAGWSELAGSAVRAAVATGRHQALLAGKRRIEVSVKFTSDGEVALLNSAWRNKAGATNVLSFPMVEPELLDALDPDGEAELLLGDIVLAHGVCASEAAAKGIALRDHAAHLVVHGALHLLGHDHETGERDAEAMEAAEREALARLGIADPYPSEVGS